MLKAFDYAYAVFGLFYMAEGFAGLLSAGAEEAADVGSPGLRNLGIAIGLIALLRIIASLPALKETLNRCWPMLVPVLVTLLSILWSGDPELAFRRSSALVLTTFFGLFLAIRFDGRQLVNCLLASLLIYCAASAFLIVAIPSIGVHTAADTRFYEHIGAWRGLSPFKNDFGRIVAFAALVFGVVAFTRPRGNLGLIGCAVLAVGLVAGSHSGQAISLLVLCALALAYLLALGKMSPPTRAAFLVMSLPSAVFLVVVGDSVVALALEALGKNPTLTGRLDIWPAVIEALHGNLLLGGGYGSGWKTLVNDKMQELLGREIGHAHNGYLNLIVDIGIFGLLSVLFALFALGQRVYTALSRQGSTELVLMGALTIIFMLLGNWVGSFLLKYNTVFWVLCVYLICEFGRQERPTVMLVRRVADYGRFIGPVPASARASLAARRTRP
ncbi:O-antigen ligase family protein [Bosea caraganae]|uniref:O-antigen ligase family protein n=1 Tax=Bosea caraganae TaxID=2763117 RepID=A0A370L4R0_9HYPH|nr:O-antigen ligase family protein [Bosea caraganae]RDJ24082.1 O-antigen ligase family protein [Bosea caraganae]RDJ30124.1 O-antigen ligase family protein [Bosea caraganae]